MKFRRDNVSPPLKQKHLGKAKFEIFFRFRTIKIEKCIDAVLLEKLIPLRSSLRSARRSDEAADDLSHGMILAMIPTVTIVFLVTICAYALTLKIFPMLGLLDFPERYGLRRNRLPYPAGIIAVIVFMTTALLILPVGQKEIGMLLGISLLAFTCFIDDRTPLPSWLRLLIQVFIVTMIFATGSRIYTITNPLGGFLKLDTLTVSTGLFGSLPILSGLFTIGWLLLTINALNWFDGISGQVSVIATIGFLMLGCLSLFRNGEPDIAVLSFSLAAIAGAGILFDFPPAKMLIGDTGSMFFGLMLGLLGVYHGGKVATVFLALGIPLIDAIFVIIRRMMKGHSPFRGGRDHLHHLLLDRGWSERSVVFLTAMIGALFGGSALFLSTAQKGVSGAILLIVMTLLHLWIKNNHHYETDKVVKRNRQD